ncbi:protein FAR1-RELATED SEQUENCE 12-like [Lactuca sativa]|uniref:protein FAR1-RELATED SEQUENCE 12-like n=1 Tax=Lactuca sativa TaxID=4236 RepID=UPI000CD9CB59|nr:protein FAR1-RELATED SEQUENCE 12-like [Lactuca sativa]
MIKKLSLEEPLKKMKTSRLQDYELKGSSLSIQLIEAKAGECYTRKNFEIFQKEWIQATSNLTHETISKCTEEIKYWVGQLDVDKTHWRVVIFRLKDKVNVTCSCAKFEAYDILCKHYLYVIKKRHAQTLLNHYILPRWSLDARFKVDTRSIGLNKMKNEKEVSALTLWYVCANSTKAIEHATNSPSKIRKLNTLLVKFLEDEVIQKNLNAPENPSQHSCAGITQVDTMPQFSIRDPAILTNTKGLPKNATTIKYSLEMVKKKRRTCSHCKGLGHYATGCLMKKYTILEISTVIFSSLHHTFNVFLL